MTDCTVTCDSCLTELKKTRYKCTACPNYDLCSNCYERNLGRHAPQLVGSNVEPNGRGRHLFLRLDDDEERSGFGVANTNRADMSNLSNFVHDKATCAGCGVDQIVGFRYSCIVCPGVHLCEGCERTGMFHDAMHPRVKILGGEAQNHATKVADRQKQQQPADSSSEKGSQNIPLPAAVSTLKFSSSDTTTPGATKSPQEKFQAHIFSSPAPVAQDTNTKSSKHAVINQFPGCKSAWAKTSTEVTPPTSTFLSHGTNFALTQQDSNTKPSTFLHYVPPSTGQSVFDMHNQPQVPTNISKQDSETTPNPSPFSFFVPQRQSFFDRSNPEPAPTKNSNPFTEMTKQERPFGKLTFASTKPPQFSFAASGENLVLQQGRNTQNNGPFGKGGFSIGAAKTPQYSFGKIPNLQFR